MPYIARCEGPFTEVELEVAHDNAATYAQEQANTTRITHR